MQEILNIIGRTEPLFTEDMQRFGDAIDQAVAGRRFLVIGGAGSIGSAVVRQLFARKPAALHVVDISENNLAELVRDIRSSMGYIEGDFSTFALDCGSVEFDALIARQPAYDYVLNFSALKHVRSEKDPFTLMRLIQVNIFNTDRTADLAARMGARKYFCVSTDKASNPVNMMGASKRIMEMFLLRRSEQVPVSTARFANVAFSDGSLPFSWRRRLERRQPLVAPDDVRRYFVTDTEGGQLCLMSTFLGENRDIFFPKLSEKLHLEKFSVLARRFLETRGYEPAECASEDEARSRVDELAGQGRWPCYFFDSDTTGEKDFEEFYTDAELVDWDRFAEVGVVKVDIDLNERILDHFTRSIEQFREQGQWSRDDLVALFGKVLPHFAHKETGKFLDEKM